MNKLKRVIALHVVLVVLAAGSVTACAHKNLTPETPRAGAALKADEIVIRLNELQAAVIQACWPTGEVSSECVAGSIPTPTAKLIVQGLIDIRTTLKSVPDGWQATVKSAWARVKPRFTGVTLPAIMVALAVVDGLIGGL